MDIAVIVLLVAVLLACLLNLGVGMLLWWRHVGLVARVARLEVYQEQNLTHAETREIYERLASIEGQIQTTNQLMKTVQDHLLETE